MSTPKKKGDNSEEREQEYMSKIRELMNNHKVGGAKSTKIMRLIGKQRFRKPGHFINKWSLMWLSVELNLGDLVEKMLGTDGVDINRQFGQRKYSCLHLASSYGFNPIIQILLQNNADYELKNSHGKTAVHIAQDDRTRKFLRKEIEKKKNLYSKFRRLQSEFSSLDDERKDLETAREELDGKVDTLKDQLNAANEVIVGKNKEIARLEDYVQKLKERGGQDEAMLEDFENNILQHSSVLTDGEKLDIGLQMMKKMVGRNKKLQEQLKKAETELGMKRDQIVNKQRSARKLGEELTITRSRSEKEIRKNQFILRKLKEKMEEISNENDELKVKKKKLEDRIRLHVKSQNESITVIAGLERSLKNSNSAINKKEERVKKLLEIIRGMSIKSDGVMTNFKKLKDEMSRQENDDLLGRSPQKKEIFKQKRQIKRLTETIGDVEGKKKLSLTRLRKLEQVVSEKQGQINLLLKKVDEKTELGVKKSTKLRKELEGANKKIEKLLFENQRLDSDKKKIAKEMELEKNRYGLLLKKEKRINLRWEKMLLQMDREKKIFDEKVRDVDFKTNNSFEQRRMQRRRKKLSAIGTNKTENKKKLDELVKQEDRKNERSVAFIRKKVSRVFDENENLKYLIKQKEEEMEQVKEQSQEVEDKAAYQIKQANEMIEGLKTEKKQLTESIEQLNIKIDRSARRRRMKEKREKDEELRRETEVVDQMLYKGRGVAKKSPAKQKRKKKKKTTSTRFSPTYSLRGLRGGRF